MNLGLIGLDTSHSPAFTRYLLDTHREISITAAWPGGSPDIPLSANRVEGFTRDIASLGVPMLESPEAVAHASDAVMILSMEGASHRAQFERIVRPGLRIFIDKPMTDTVADAEALNAQATSAGASVFSASALRFLPAFRDLLKKTDRNNNRRVHLQAPLNSPEGIPKYHFYAIHAVELLIAALGPDWCSVDKTDNNGMTFEIRWKGGGSADLVFMEPGNAVFSLSVEYEGGVEKISDLRAGVNPRYGPLLEETLAFFSGSSAPVSIHETIAGIRLLEELDRLGKSPD